MKCYIAPETPRGSHEIIQSGFTIEWDLYSKAVWWIPWTWFKAGLILIVSQDEYATCKDCNVEFLFSYRQYRDKLCHACAHKRLAAMAQGGANDAH